MHLVLGQILGFDRLKSASTDVQRDAGALDAARLQIGQQRRVKVQRRRRCGDSTGRAGKHGLIALGVFCGIRVVAALLLALDVRRQRQVAVALHQVVGRLSGRAVQRKAKQRAVLVWPAPQQQRIKAAAAPSAGHVDDSAGQRFFADLHVRYDFIAVAFGQHALDQQFELAATGLLAKHARFDDAGVVEHQQVASAQQAGQVFKDAIDRLRGAAVQQARGAALGRWVLGNQCRWQGEVEVAQGVSNRRRRISRSHACLRAGRARAKKKREKTSAKGCGTSAIAHTLRRVGGDFPTALVACIT